MTQDLSVSGYQKGFSKEDWENGKATRSGMLWEFERIIKELYSIDPTMKSKLPRFLFMENVPQVVSPKNGNKETFEIFTSYLESIGYTNHFFILNAKDFGVPQNRKRAYMISILGDEEYECPAEIELRYAMRNILEDEVDERYYINSERANALIDKLVETNTIRTEQNRTEQNNRP